MIRPLLIVAAAILAAVILHAWLGIEATDLLWDTCDPPPPQVEIPWPTHKPCPEAMR
ncbi:MAG: hypothetical protein H8K10_02020 [Nitrospira sp.]|nr:hypothetical protein [Nitrospira sp.]